MKAGRDIVVSGHTVSIGNEVYTVPDGWREQAEAAAEGLEEFTKENVGRELDRLEVELKQEHPNKLRLETILDFVQRMAPSVVTVLITLMPFLLQ